MDHLFITSSGELHPHWLDVFPQAKARASFQGRPQFRADTVVWVEWPPSVDERHSLERPSLERHYQELNNLVSLGKPVVVLSPLPSDVQAQTALSLGAKGYCHSLASSEQLKDVATVVTSGGLWLGPDLLQRVLKGGLSVAGSLPGSTRQKALAQLTKREAAVAQAAAEGLTNREIADKLDIGERTVKSHLSIVFQKLSLRDRVHLALLLNDIESSSR